MIKTYTIHNLKNKLKYIKRTPNNKSIVNDRNWGVKGELGKNHQENYEKRFVSFRYVIVALIIFLFSASGRRT